MKKAKLFMQKINKIKNKKVIQAWLLKADDDFNFAQDAFRETDYYDHVCFLSQQAVEKYLKALIIIFTGTLTKQQKTHNLIFLADILKNNNFNLSEFKIKLRKLSEAYIPARYPTDTYVRFSKEDAKECLTIAREMIEYIKSRINLNFFYEKN